jgi:hypothetical protein
MKISRSNLIQPDGPEVRSVSRRGFFRYAGASAGIMAVAASCKKGVTGTNPGHLEGYDLGGGDVGILNYAYTLEQLEAAFYTLVIDNAYSGMTSDETAMLTDIRDHEIAHREFFKAALGTSAIGPIEFDFSSIDFSSRDSVLAAAKNFEDIGVAAYNGAGPLLTDATNLLIAGKIVSVEARHAAYISDLISPASFSDTVVDSNGLERSLTPNEVLMLVKPFMKAVFDDRQLPTS